MAGAAEGVWPDSNSIHLIAFDYTIWSAIDSNWRVNDSCFGPSLWKSPYRNVAFPRAVSVSCG
jgi:hypothetical protein